MALGILLDIVSGADTEFAHVLYQITETIKAALYPVIGNLAYEVGLRWIAFAILLPPTLVLVFFLYRGLRRGLRKRARAKQRMFEELSLEIAENRRLLQILVADRDNQMSDIEP